MLARRGARHPLHPPVVHRHPRPAEGVLDQRHRAGRRVRGRDGLRRLLDHRLQPDRGVGHDRDAGPDDVRGPALAPCRAGRRADVLRHPHPRAHPVRGRPAARPAPRAAAGRGDGLRPLLRRPRARVLLLPRLEVDRGARRGRLLRPDHAGRRLRPAPRDRAGARAARDPHRVHPPRGRPQPARDRHALRRRAEDGRRLHDLPDHGQGIRDEVRAPRHVHAQAAVRQERIGDAHPPVAVPRRRQRVLRRRRPVLPIGRRQGVHRRPAAPRPRDLLDLRPVGQLLQAPGPGLRGAGVRGLVAPQPLGAGPRPALPPG